MGVKMIADNRKKPSLARRKVVRAEREAELDRRLAEGIRSWFAFDPGVKTGLVEILDGKLVN